ncbi:FadR family transcriptional regulator [Starkeya koreensis]|uniref:FadR family transcriptional regulator n=1 Tax=Ancylobacter koreensis TaxID=266121 RepID=A0ABT0DIE2_9HYPH|nr:FadR/GntR family transcriptional regulator [Ancylobacter koreensis]MCK0207041.1 FadR family transcriptional regulator [Ancylobacter koreensis]
MDPETEGEPAGGQTGTAARRSGTPGATQLAVTALQRMIAGGDFAPGGPLPPQRALAATLDISRATLREALSILATLGLVSIEPGRGTYVRATADETPEHQPAPSWRFAARYSPAEVYQFRYIAESHAAQLAAMTHSATEIAELRDNLARLRAAAQATDLAAFAQIDFEFHRLIMRFSRNRLLADMHASFGRVLLESSRLPARRDRLWEPVREHERILEALTMGDPEGAGYYMRHHITRTADRAGIALAELV